MASPNEIAGLCTIAVKPALWRITNFDGNYYLEFSWYQGDKAEFIHVQTQRTGKKEYRSIKTLMQDIAKVDKFALIQLEFVQIG